MSPQAPIPLLVSFWVERHRATSGAFGRIFQRASLSNWSRCAETSRLTKSCTVHPVMFRHTCEVVLLRFRNAQQGRGQIGAFGGDEIVRYAGQRICVQNGLFPNFQFFVQWNDLCKQRVD